jgi:hypothetical protein
MERGPSARKKTDAGGSGKKEWGFLVPVIIKKYGRQK